MTVIVSVPAAAPATASVEPFNATEEVAGLDELAVCLRLSPSGSVKYEDALIENIPPYCSVRSEMLPTVQGGRFVLTTRTVILKANLDKLNTPFARKEAAS